MSAYPFGVTVTHPTEPHAHFRFATEASAHSAVDLINALPETEQRSAYYRGRVSETPCSGVFTSVPGHDDHAIATGRCIGDFNKALPHRAIFDIRNMTVIDGNYQCVVIAGWRANDQLPTG